MFNDGNLIWLAHMLCFHFCCCFWLFVIFCIVVFVVCFANFLIGLHCFRIGTPTEVVNYIWQKFHLHQAVDLKRSLTVMTVKHGNCVQSLVYVHEIQL